MGFSESVYASLSCKLLLVSLCIWNCSQEFIIGSLFSRCKMFNMSSMFPYVCPVSSICWEYLDVVLLDFIACMCSLNLVLKFLPVCPTYFLGQLLHLISYIPHRLYLSRTVFFVCKYFCKVLLVLYAMRILVFMNNLAIIKRYILI
jgi:hypothetical protein